ncbi:RidA family protein [Parasalinivibrio latis]|uniref:RidA family protein n=1 Tax=Parasalinivibrio latis TaxID=2952610 RepID=UPI0030E1807C
MTPEQRIAALGIVIPELVSPVGQYIHGKRLGNLLYLSGKGTVSLIGKVGRDLTTSQAKQASREIGLYLLAAIIHEAGSLGCVRQIVKINGYINATPDFTEHPAVIDGCSQLFIDVFGDDGKHVRTSVGVSSLPGNMPVEIEAVVEMKLP